MESSRLDPSTDRVVLFRITRFFLALRRHARDCRPVSEVRADNVKFTPILPPVPETNRLVFDNIVLATPRLNHTHPLFHARAARWLVVVSLVVGRSRLKPRQ